MTASAGRGAVIATAAPTAAHAGRSSTTDERAETVPTVVEDEPYNQGIDKPRLVGWTDWNETLNLLEVA